MSHQSAAHTLAADSRKMQKKSCKFSNGGIMPSDSTMEMVRDALPLLADPIAPNEKVRVWIDRAARRIGDQVSSSRLLSYWHRKVFRHDYEEVCIILSAYNLALAKHRAKEEFRSQINRRAEILGDSHASITRHIPILARVLPRPLGSLPISSDEVTPPYFLLGRDAE